MEIRRLDEDDTDAMRRHFTEAFGEHDPPDPPVSMFADGKTWWGAQVDGRLVATVLDRRYDSWFGGERVPTAGVGGVAVAAEHRGSGVLGPLFDEMLRGARERGAVVSTLFATAPGVYRRLGYETVASLVDVRLPTSAWDVGGDTPVRRATDDDAEAIRAVHERSVAREHGALSHDGPLFVESPALRVSGVTVAERDGHVVGYARWDRGRGYGDGAELRVWELLADDADALRSLMSTMSSFSSVTPSLLVRTSGVPAWQHVVRTSHPTPVASWPYALAVLDPVALTFPRVPVGLEGWLPFVVGDVAHAIEIADGEALLHDGDGSGRTFTRGGLALTFAGAHPSAALRSLGHVGGDETDDGAWDALTLRGPVTVHDYF